MINHVRPDGEFERLVTTRSLLIHYLLGSSFHVVEYNSTTGDVIDRRTSQGYADNSTWTRGQAWGIYGFATSKLVTERSEGKCIVNLSLSANSV